MATWRNSSFTQHAPDSPNERFGPGSSSMTCQYDLFNGSFQSRLQAAYDFLGYGIVLPGSGSEPWYLSRVVPFAYPGLDPDLILPAPDAPLSAGYSPPDITNNFYAQAISRTEMLGVPLGIDPLATPVAETAADHHRARLTVEFSTLPYLIKTDAQLGNDSNGFPNEGKALASGWQNSRYIIRHGDAFSRIIKLPYGMMWNQGTNPAKQTKVGVPWREGGCNACYTWIRVPLTGGAGTGAVNFGRINSALTTINNAQFDIFPANTLLFDNFTTREYQGSFGERLIDISMNFIFLPHASTGLSGKYSAGTCLGWNYILDVINGQIDYYLATSDRAGANPGFRATDFSTLFSP